MARRLIVACALLLAMAVPRSSDAGLIDFILEMSGPQMIGFGYGCLFRFEKPPANQKSRLEECRLGGVAAYSTFRNDDPTRAEEQALRNRFFFALNGAYYLSTGKDSGENNENHYDWQDVQMLATSGSVLFRSTPTKKNWRVYHGAGGEYDFLFGRNFRRFDKFAFTFTPVDVSYKRLSVGLTARLYPNGFTADEFGLAPRVSFDRKREWVMGFNVGWAIFQK